MPHTLNMLTQTDYHVRTTAAPNQHFICIKHITAIRPRWDRNDEWVRRDIYMLGGSIRSGNTSFEQIMDALAHEYSSLKKP